MPFGGAGGCLGTPGVRVSLHEVCAREVFGVVHAPSVGCLADEVFPEAWM